ncbi:MAG TPA: hypothetical protein DHW82_05320 [Spirochaetia bacterium]|nr:hypothetical protein [Spirochaetia bacterium]
MKEIQILPGELFFTEEEYQITTILGSCVSVTFFHSQTKSAGIFHALMPYFNDRKSKNPFDYIDYSMNYLLEKFQKKKISLNELEIKLFGGSNMFSLDDQKKIYSIGSHNVETAKELLKARNLEIMIEDTGGSSGRKIIFNTSTGDVFRKFLRNF